MPTGLLNGWERFQRRQKGRERNWPVRGPGTHLVGGARAYHGLIGWRELSGVQQAWAVDGDAVQSAERGGSEVQVEAPEWEKEEGHPLGKEPTVPIALRATGTIPMQNSWVCEKKPHSLGGSNSCLLLSKYTGTFTNFMAFSMTMKTILQLISSLIKCDCNLTGNRQPTPVFLPRESHGQRSLVGFGPWGSQSDTTEHACMFNLRAVLFSESGIGLVLPGFPLGYPAVRPEEAHGALSIPLHHHPARGSAVRTNIQAFIRLPSARLHGQGASHASPIPRRLPILGPQHLLGRCPRRHPPVGLGSGCAGVLWRVIGRRGQRGHELIEIQGLVEHGTMRGQAGWAGRRCPLWKELEDREVLSDWSAGMAYVS